MPCLALVKFWRGRLAHFSVRAKQGNIAPQSTTSTATRWVSCVKLALELASATPWDSVLALVEAGRGLVGRMSSIKEGGGCGTADPTSRGGHFVHDAASDRSMTAPLDDRSVTTVEPGLSREKRGRA